MKSLPYVVALASIALLPLACSSDPTDNGGGNTPIVASVVLSSGTISLAVGATTTVTATPKDGNGGTVAGQTVTWTSSNTSVATVTSPGATTTVSGVSADTATITATVGTLTAKATVTVTSTSGPTVASVTISPSSPSVGVGGSVSLTAAPKDANGGAVAGRPITWMSSNNSVATVASTGGYTADVTGASADTATITATVDGIDGTASVTVTAPGTSLVNECDTPKSGWIWCDDFESDRLSSYFEYNNPGGRFIRVANVGVDSSTAMRAQWGMGDQGAGYLQLAFGRNPSSYFKPVDAGTQDYREIYWRLFLKLQPGWIRGGGDKLSRAFVLADGTNWSQAMIAHVWSGQVSSGSDSTRLDLDPASGTDAGGNVVTTGYNDFAHLQFLGLKESSTPIFDAAQVGSWYCIEAHVKLNDAGMSNGVFELYIDEALEASSTNLDWVASYSDYGINAVYVENYWNSGAPQAQERYIDNFVVSTAPIGCS